MSTLTPEDRARLRDLASQATPGPWEAEHGSDWDLDGRQVPQSSVRRADRVAITWDDHGGEVFVPADAEFIAAARTAVPALLDALDAAEAAVERVRDLNYASTDGTEWEHNGHVPDLGEAECPGCWVKEIHRALDGDA